MVARLIFQRIERAREEIRSAGRGIVPYPCGSLEIIDTFANISNF